MTEVARHSSCSLYDASLKKHASSVTQRQRKSENSHSPKEKVYVWYCCYCGSGGMPYNTPGCDFCNNWRCDFCVVENFTAGWKGKKNDFYNRCKDAALLGSIPAEPDLLSLQPPDLTQQRPTTFCTTPEPDSTHDKFGLQKILSDPRPKHVTSQSLNGQGGFPVSSTIIPRMEFDLSSLSLDQADTIDLCTNPSPIDTYYPKKIAESASFSSPPTDTLNHILLAFDAWKVRASNGTTASDSSTTPGPAPSNENSRSSAPNQSRKRRSNQGSSSKQGSPKRAKVSSDEKLRARKEDKCLLACPFWKKDPIKHRDCFKGVKRIRDVKQHLRRSHQQPVYFCHRCGMQYRDEETDLWVEHNRTVDSERCEIRPIELPDGITKAQLDGLTRYSDRNTDEADQWYVIWDFVFPDDRIPRPRSPYVNQDLSEDMSSFREFSHSEGWNALASDPNLWNITLLLDEELLQRCLNRIHDRWLAKREANSQPSRDESPLTLSNVTTPEEEIPTNNATPIDHLPQDEGLMPLGELAADLGPNDSQDAYQFDDQFFRSTSFLATTSLITPQTLSSVPLPKSTHQLEHETQLAALDPTIISR